MLGFCSCFYPKNKPVEEEITFHEHQVDHYQLSIPTPQRSLSEDSLKNPLGSQPETATDTSSLPFQADASRFSSNTCPLFFPTRDPLSPSSDLVSSNNSNFETILDLESDPDWELKQDKPFAYIMIRSGSPDYPNIPMMKAFFDLELDVEPELLHDILYDPKSRKKWDTSIGEYKVIDKIRDDVVQYYMLNKAPWPFTDRDFVETRYVRRRNNGDMEIFYRASESEEFVESGDKVIRGQTIFGGQIFRKRISPNSGKPSLLITTICQADLKGEIPKKLLKITLPSSMLKWFRSIKKQLELALKANTQE